MVIKIAVIVTRNVIVKSSLLRNFFLLSFLLAPCFSYADTDDSDVTTWTQDILLNTLSVDYSTYENTFQTYQVNYTQNARDALRGFLGNYLPVIQQNQLTLHPLALNTPQVVNEGYFSGIHFWRINQAIALPELNSQISFSVVVIKANGNPPYIIQSVSMVKQPYP